VAFGEMMADRWRDFVVESHQRCLMLPSMSLVVSHGDTHDAVRAQKRWDHAGIGYDRLGAHAFIATTV
jgi:hypothetical protein